METADYDIVIVGGGAAGLSAALYAGRASLKTLMLEKLGCGGQILLTGAIENYPGFSDGILGPELSQRMCDQASRYGAEIRYEEVEALDHLERPVKTVTTGDGAYTAKTVIVTAGGSHKKLGIPGEEEFSGRGVSYCAVCDANFFRGEDVVVVGGGDAAMDEGNYLSSIVNKVTVIHRRDQLRASPILQERSFANPKMDFLWSHVVEEIKGNEIVEAAIVKDLKTGKVYDYPTAAAFIYIGFTPNIDFLQGQLELDESGCVVTDIAMAASKPGVFAAGDIRSGSFRQLGSAVGDGITAALSAYHYIQNAGS